MHIITDLWSNHCISDYAGWRGRLHTAAHLLKSKGARLASVVLDIANVELGVGIIHLGKDGPRWLAHKIDQHVQPPTVWGAYLTLHMDRQ